MGKQKTILLAFALVFLAVAGNQVFAAEPSLLDYTSYPIFQISAVQPNILIMLDNSLSMNLQAYTRPYDHNIKYYGYFEPYQKYRYESNVFVRDPNGTWDGNFLNWLTMRRVDVARKVIMGGLATSRMGTGNQTNIGEAPSAAGSDFTKSYADADNVTPFDSGTTLNYVVDAGNFYVSGSTYVIRVEKNMNTYPDEAYNFADGNISGVLQKIGGRARWGNEFFNYGTGRGGSGGRIASTIGTNLTSLITDLQNTQCNTFTPLAEAYYVATQYFKQQPPQSGLDYPNNAVPCSNIGDDPFYNGTEYVPCAKSFVIILSDGGSTYDMMIPETLKDFDKDTLDPGSYPDSGSHYLDDIALYARTTDLRQDLQGDQNLILYTIYAFGEDTAGVRSAESLRAEELLKLAAKKGGFNDRNGDKKPNDELREEWDANYDNDPDTYFRAEDGYQLEEKLLAAVNDILRRAASGTAVSVLATSGEGEANLVQAYFLPSYLEGLSEIKWLGYLQSLWVDPFGYLREDTDGDGALDVGVDKIVSYFVDPGTGDTKIKRFNVSPTDSYPDLSSASYETLALDQINPLWEAGKQLSERSEVALPRKIFTFVDKNQNGGVDETPASVPMYSNLDTNDEVISFNSSAASLIKPYLGVRDNTAWGYLGANHDTRVSNLISYIRGNEISGLRSRTKGGHVWKLGDIVHSTPVSVSRPPDNFHIIYSDESYENFYNAFKDRETVIYVGANDGMLHAFTSWKYDSSSKTYTRPSGTMEEMGDELWAYIPQSLLPHLKWLPSDDYTHVFYADLKPKVFDAKILPDDTHYIDGDTDDNWGTILLLGLNMGGKTIQVQDDFNYDGTVGSTEIRTFYPSYACVDVTDPRNPRLLWEKTYKDLEMSASMPAVIRVKDKWFAVFGSGPSNYDGTTSKKGHVFVVNLKTGEPYRSGTNDWLFETAESAAFLNSPVTLDKDLNFNVDGVYFGETYLQGGSWKGKVYKVTIPWPNTSGRYSGTDLSRYSDNPLDTSYPWRLSTLFDATRPVTAPLLLSNDAFGNVWIYGGTGRFMSAEDKVNSDTQYIFGIKDPFFNEEHSPSGYFADDYYQNYNTFLQLQIANLFNADGYLVTTTREVFKSGASVGNWTELLNLARAKDGWIRTLPLSKERVLNKASILGGIVLTPSFIPNADLCGSGGESYLYGFYYETGTPYYKSVFTQGPAEMTILGQLKLVILDKISLGCGKASSVGIHVGRKSGATGIIQQSTGNIITEDLTPAFKVKSGLRSWQEK